MDGIKPYISFNGNCKEAVDFYRDKLGAEVMFTQTYGESPMADQAPGSGDKVMHTSFRVGESVIMACDNVWGGENAATGSNISLAWGSDDAAATERAFEAMSDGANITMPLQQTFWAERFGMLTDKFGINWMFNCETPHGDGAGA
jgi:PhnB protein